MSRPRDYYRILHVQPDAPAEIINASYRTLMQQLRHHPDLGGDHDTAVLLNEAHAVLSDPERRAAYDASRAPARGGMGASAAAAEPDAALGRARCSFCNAPHGIKRALAPDDECARCASPLFPAERQRLEYSGQRMLSRIPKALAVRMYTRWPQAAAHAAELRDASLNGMQVSTEFRLEQNRVLRVDCQFCRAVGRVAHCRRDPANASRWLIGLEFVTLRFASARGNFVSTSA
jgi:curved DNA-binding protein CbpA